jgi:hypothetical protein
MRDLTSGVLMTLNDRAAGRRAPDVPVERLALGVALLTVAVWASAFVWIVYLGLVPTAISSSNWMAEAEWRC